MYPISTSTASGHRHRLRERFMKAKAAGFHDYELLELLLTYAIPRRDVKPIAKQLIAHFGGLNGVFDADRNELLSVSGVGTHAAVLLNLFKELTNVYLLNRAKERDFVTSPEKVIEFAWSKIAGRSHETFLVLFLNTQNEIINHAILNEGTIDQVAVYPRRIIEMALAFKAKGLILVHNHPSGHVEPSDDDRQLTRTVKSAIEMLDMRLLDHIIVGKKGYFSFSERSLL